MRRMYSDLEESSQQAIQTWKLFAERSKKGEIREWPGATAAFSGGNMPFLNMAFLSSPVADAADLEQRMHLILNYANATGVPWMMFAADDWLPEELRRTKDDVYAMLNLHPALTFRGMVTESLTPEGPVAAELSVRRVEDEETRLAISDINCISYDMSVELGRSSMDEGFWRDEDFAYVGFVDGVAASAAAVWLVDGVAYVGMVATLPAYRRRGYAEITMRHALAQTLKATGIRRSVLHATESGFPIYKRMGYRQVASFTIYTLPH